MGSYEWYVPPLGIQTSHTSFAETKTAELFGRQYLFFGTYFCLTAFNAGAAGSQNMATLIVLRFLAGAFGSSPLTNAGGVIADMFPAAQRGLATSLFAAAPFLGPVIGPIGRFLCCILFCADHALTYRFTVGGFVGETIGWRWIEGGECALSVPRIYMLRS